MKTVTIPANIKIVDWTAFAFLPSLSDIYFGGSREQFRKLGLSYLESDNYGINIHFGKEDSANTSVSNIDSNNDSYSQNDFGSSDNSANTSNRASYAINTPF